MSREALHELVERAIADKKFRRRLVANPDKVLSGFDLDPEERAAVYRVKDALSSNEKEGLDFSKSFISPFPGQWL